MSAPDFNTGETRATFLKCVHNAAELAIQASRWRDSAHRELMGVQPDDEHHLIEASRTLQRATRHADAAHEFHHAVIDASEADPARHMGATLATKWLHAMGEFCELEQSWTALVERGTIDPKERNDVRKSSKQRPLTEPTALVQELEQAVATGKEPSWWMGWIRKDEKGRKPQTLDELVRDGMDRFTRKCGAVPDSIVCCPENVERLTHFPVAIFTMAHVWHPDYFLIGHSRMARCGAEVA